MTFDKSNVVIPCKLRNLKMAYVFPLPDLCRSGPDDKEDVQAGMAYLTTPEKTGTISSVPSFTTSNGVRSLSAVYGDDEEFDTPWGMTRHFSIGSGDLV